jgi:RHS repeat-associated protein
MTDTSGFPIKSTSYKYDVYDQRTAKIVDLDGDGLGAATTERFVYGSNQNIALVFDGNGTLTHRYLFANGIDQIEADEQLATGTTLWALTDHLGSVRDVVDNSGVNQNHIVYDAFGNITSQSNSSVIFRNSYTGQEFDPESGLFSYGGRYYDPFTGKFIQEDKIGFSGGDANLNRYVFNSPTNLIDPIGNQAIRFLAPFIRQFPTNQLGVPDSRFNIDKNLIEIEDTFGKVKRGLLDFLTPPAGDPNADRNSRINQLKGVPLPRPGEIAPSKSNPLIEEEEETKGGKKKPNPNPTPKRPAFPLTRKQAEDIGRTVFQIASQAVKSTLKNPNNCKDHEPKEEEKECDPITPFSIQGGPYSLVSASNTGGEVHHMPSSAAIRNSNILLGASRQSTAN